MKRDELKLRAICLASSFCFAVIADVVPLGLVEIGAAVSAVLFFCAAWIPWDL